ncbi:MAG: MFS transporter [Deltaproteobacteria bacterium]|nr:MFS transporter [Deltaproteobacteria bacterium]
MHVPQIFRFSLYGFLKNQQYYDPFIVLVFLEKGLSFFMIGLLIGFREICINIMEIPSGAIADLFGRRRAMILSFSAYIISFAVFAMSSSLALLFGAMFFFAVGDAFRSGTHKAMIFDWLEMQGRSNERTKVYGFTRSWSKMGSAVSVLIAAGLVFYTGNYSTIFLFSIVPYAFNIINFLGYPATLDGERTGEFSIMAVVRFLGRALKQSVTHPPLRRLVIESMGFEGMYKASKDYLQPILKQTVLVLPLLMMFDDKKRAALLVGAVYFVLHFLSSMASRRAHKLADWRGGEDAAGTFIWRVDFLIFACLIPGLWLNWYPVSILGFIILAIFQNFWRPVLVSRINAHSESRMGATVLSIEAQGKSFATMLLAPILGWCVDRAGGFWPLGLIGLLIASGVLLTAKSDTDSRPANS